MHGVLPRRQLRVLGVQDRFPFAYNSPRNSGHLMERRRLVPLERLYQPLGGAGMINPWPPKPFDLVHCMRRVPVGPTPFVIGFDWHLPLSWEKDAASFNAVMNEILSPKCRRVVAVSRAAASATLHRHENHPRFEELRAKTTVRLPNVPVPDTDDWFDPASAFDQLRLVFVGDHFARKGGCVAVKLAERARAAGLPIHITIVSSLACGKGIWTDPDRADFFEPYLKLLHQPNITVLQYLSPAGLQDIMARAHLLLLPTLSDTIDYTLLEGMASYTPAIATAITSFPEIIDANNGVLLPVETNCQGEWKHMGRIDRGSPEFEAVFVDTIEQLTDRAFAACVELLNDPGKLASMRKAARRTIEEKCDANDASAFWDELYLEAVLNQ